MDKLNFSQDSFPLTVENLKLIYRKSDIAERMLLTLVPFHATEVYLLYNGPVFLYLCVYKNEIFYIPEGREGTGFTLYLVEKKETITTDQDTYPNIRTLRYAVGDRVKNDESLIYSVPASKQKELNLYDLIQNIQNSADVALEEAHKATLTKTYAIKGAPQIGDNGHWFHSISGFCIYSQDTEGINRELILDFIVKATDVANYIKKISISDGSETTSLISNEDGVDISLLTSATHHFEEFSYHCFKDEANFLHNRIRISCFYYQSEDFSYIIDRVLNYAETLGYLEIKTITFDRIQA